MCTPEQRKGEKLLRSHFVRPHLTRTYSTSRFVTSKPLHPAKDTIVTMGLPVEFTPIIPTPQQPQTHVKPVNGFVGHVIDNKYTLCPPVIEDLTRQERVYQVSCAGTTTDTTIYAKEFSLTNISPKLYQSRRRNVRNFANKRNVLSCVDYCGKKFIIFDLTPKEPPARKGKGRALDPELDEDDDEATNGDLEGRVKGFKTRKAVDTTAARVKPSNEAAPGLLDDTPNDDNSLRPQKYRRPRPRRGWRRALHAGATGTGAGSDAKLPSPNGQGGVGMEESGEWAISDESDDSDWDSTYGDLDDDLQRAAEVTLKEEVAQDLLRVHLAVEASLREENDRFLKILEWALRVSSLDGKEKVEG